jgi:MFS transporter, DHA1 family, inner membrane transport protein
MAARPNQSLYYRSAAATLETMPATTLQPSLPRIRTLRAGTEREPRTTNLTWALLALSLGGFGIGTGEFVIMGLLPGVADGIGVSITQAGHVISSYALGVVVGAPLFAVLGARLPRRGMLVGLMAVFLGGNVLSALAPTYATLIGARFLTGLPHGAFFGIASLVAADMAGPGRRAWAVSRMMIGLSVANVVGVPAATWLGQAIGWRSAFVAVAIIAAATVVAVLRWVPSTATSPDASMRRELGALRRSQVWLTLGIGTIGFGGFFAVYTFIAPTLTERAGLPESAIPAVLAVWGLGMVASNLIAGRYIDRSPVRSIYAILLLIAASLAIFAFASANPVAVVFASFLVAAGVALGPALQTRLMDVAADAQTLAATLNHAALNIGNALGAWLGGLAIAAGGGWASPSWVGVGLAFGALAILTVSVVLERRR